MKPFAFLVILVLLALAAAPASASNAVGVYVGTGPSHATDTRGACSYSGSAELLLRGPAAPGGTWGIDISGMKLPADGTCGGAFQSWSWFPSHIADNLQGSPEEGFRASGFAAYTTPGGSERLWWTVEVGPVSDATAWAVNYTWVQRAGAPTAYWNGTASFVGLGHAYG